MEAPCELTRFPVVSDGVTDELSLSIVCFVLWLVDWGMTAATAPVSTRFYDVLAFMILSEAEVVSGLGFPTDW